ncbi:DUF2510 domain-containing protein [Thermocrispum sp.]|uniref:DUF2510 domain-containing protein n=1 Tax=Thermocrispum sp. TaxID=2060768 RepID=UPI00257DBA61|nr:DUF2510 domain-containing protein [Thermocrispum sp.]
MQPQPGWYQDPTGRNQLRYWDGNQWTTHIVNNGVVGNEASPQAGQGEPAGATTPSAQQHAASNPQVTHTASGPQNAYAPQATISASGLTPSAPNGPHAAM